MNATHETMDETWRRASAAYERFCAEWLRSLGDGAVPDAQALMRALANGLAADPARVDALQQAHYRAQLELWRSYFAAPGAPPPADEPEHDPRFAAPEWRDIPWFAYLRRAYALSAGWIIDLVEAARADEPTRRRLRFYARQFLDAMAPTNFPATNPEALKLALDSRGTSLARGLQHLVADAEKGRVSMTDETAYAVGRDLALTEGAVIYRNDLIELLQYRPRTPQVHERALVIVPPCINKYYILDLRPENSFVRYALANGLTVFMISWRNLPASLGHLTWDDYLEHGVMRALEVAREVSAAPKVNALGFCVGGTLLAAALAVLRAKRKRPAASLTLLASMLDFSDPGEIGVYIDEGYVRRCEETFRAGGILPGARLAAAFASLRANDLIWRYVVNNYLKGRTPPAFDLLHWNSDSANLAGPMYAYYLRHMYLENALPERGRLAMCGVPVDLARIELPAYVLATAEDHIVPWPSAYRSAQLLGVEPVFVLGASGHIAGVVNPPAAGRRSYRTGDIVATPRDWLQQSTAHPGSWWPHWLGWLKARSGALMAAPGGLGNSRYPALQSAPGSYVLEGTDAPPATAASRPDQSGRAP